MADVIAIIVGQMCLPIFVTLVVPLICVHMWQMEKPLEGVEPSIYGWQMFLPMWQMESHLKEWQMLIASCGWWNSHIVRWQMLLPL